MEKWVSLIMVKKNSNRQSEYFTLCRNVVNKYFEILDSLKDTEFHNEFCCIISNLDLLCEVFRYCLCEVLNLKSATGSPNLDEVRKYIINCLSKYVYDEVGLRKDLEECYRQGLLQACSRIILVRRDKARGYYGDGCE